MKNYHIHTKRYSVPLPMRTKDEIKSWIRRHGGKENIKKIYVSDGKRIKVLTF